MVAVFGCLVSQLGVWIRGSVGCEKVLEVGVPLTGLVHVTRQVVMARSRSHCVLAVVWFDLMQAADLAQWGIVKLVLPERVSADLGKVRLVAITSNQVLE